MSALRAAKADARAAGDIAGRKRRRTGAGDGSEDSDAADIARSAMDVDAEADVDMAKDERAGKDSAVIELGDTPNWWCGVRVGPSAAHIAAWRDGAMARLLLYGSAAKDAENKAGADAGEESDGEGTGTKWEQERFWRFLVEPCMHVLDARTLNLLRFHVERDVGEDAGALLREHGPVDASLDSNFAKAAQYLRTVAPFAGVMPHTVSGPLTTAAGEAAAGGDLQADLLLQASELQRVRDDNVALISQVLARIQRSGESHSALQHLRMRLSDDLVQALAGPRTTMRADGVNIAPSPADAVDDGHEVLPAIVPHDPDVEERCMRYFSSQRGRQDATHTSSRHRLRRQEYEPHWERAVQMVAEDAVAWRCIGHNLERGVRDQAPDFNQHRDADDTIPSSWLLPVDGRPAAPRAPAAQRPSEEDAVCSVCFYGHGSDMNPVVYCDGCDLGIHQRCYGLLAIPEDEFFCDVCQVWNDSRGRDRVAPSISDFRCALCPIAGGALKRTTDGHWVHVTCALWHTGTWILDLWRMQPIEVRHQWAAVYALQRVRSAQQLEPLLQGPASCEDIIECMYRHPRAGFGAYTLATDIELQRAAPLSGTGNLRTGCELLQTLPPADVRCTVCGLTMGRLVACSCSACTALFHPLCAWYAGLYMRAIRPSATTPSAASAVLAEHPSWPHANSLRCVNEQASALYPGGGRGLYFVLLCAQHAPADRNSAAQAKLRARYRVFERADLHGAGASDDAKQGAPGMQSMNGVVVTERSLSRRLHRHVAQVSRTDRDLSDLVDAYRSDKCAVCMDVSANPSADLAHCVECAVAVHPACYGVDSAAAGAESKFLCERCAWVDDVAGVVDEPLQQRRIAAAGGVVLKRPDGVLVADVLCRICFRRGGAMKPLRGRTGWIHVFCGLTLPGVSWVVPERLAYPSLQQVAPRSLHERCCLCTRLVGACVRCPACAKPLHSMCAAHRNCFFEWRVRAATNVSEPYVYCKDHAPPGFVYSDETQTWTRDPDALQASLQQLQRLQQSLRGGRQLLQAVRHREILKSRLLAAQDAEFDAALHAILPPAAQVLSASTVAVSAPAPPPGPSAPTAVPILPPPLAAVTVPAPLTPQQAKQARRPSVSKPPAHAGAAPAAAPDYSVGLEAAIPVRIRMAQASSSAIMPIGGPAAATQAYTGAAGALRQLATHGLVVRLGSLEAAMESRHTKGELTDVLTPPSTSKRAAAPSAPSTPKAPPACPPPPGALDSLLFTMLSIISSFTVWDGGLTSLTVPRYLLEAGYLSSIGVREHLEAARRHPSAVTAVPLQGETALYHVTIARRHGAAAPVANDGKQSGTPSRLPEPLVVLHATGGSVQAWPTSSDGGTGVTFVDLWQRVLARRYNTVEEFFTDMRTWFSAWTAAFRGTSYPPHMRELVGFISDMIRTPRPPRVAALFRPATRLKAKEEESHAAAEVVDTSKPVVKRKWQPAALQSTFHSPLDHAFCAYCGDCVALASLGPFIALPMPAQWPSSTEPRTGGVAVWNHRAWLCTKCWRDRSLLGKLVGMTLWYFDALLMQWMCGQIHGYEPKSGTHYLRTGLEASQWACYDLVTKYVAWGSTPPDCFPSGLPAPAGGPLAAAVASLGNDSPMSFEMD